MSTEWPGNSVCVCVCLSVTTFFLPLEQEATKYFLVFKKAIKSYCTKTK